MIQRVDVLVVDDRAADAEITLFAIQRARPELRILWLNSGDLALQYLFCGHERRLRTNAPRLILLSQNMQRMSGPALLDVVRCHAITSSVVMLRRAHETSAPSAGARFDPDSYLRRSTDAEEYCLQVEELLYRWLEHGPSTANIVSDCLATQSSHQPQLL